MLKVQMRHAQRLVEGQQILGSGIAALAVCASLVIVGCGQKGPLVLPAPTGAASAPASVNGAAR
jgi:predicted small lipoprotein YifL